MNWKTLERLYKKGRNAGLALTVAGGFAAGAIGPLRKHDHEPHLPHEEPDTIMEDATLYDSYRTVSTASWQVYDSATLLQPDQASAQFQATYLNAHITGT